MADQLNMGGLNLGENQPPAPPQAQRSYIPPHMRNKMGGAPGGPPTAGPPVGGPGGPGGPAGPGPAGPGPINGLNNSAWAGYVAFQIYNTVFLSRLDDSLALSSTSLLTEMVAEIGAMDTKAAVVAAGAAMIIVAAVVVAAVDGAIVNPITITMVEVRAVRAMLVMEATLSRLVATGMANGAMVSISQDLLTPVWNVNSLEQPMILPNSTRVSTLKSMMISLWRLVATTFPRLFISSPIRPSTTT